MTEQKQPALVSWKICIKKEWGASARLPDLWWSLHKACMRAKLEERGAPLPEPLWSLQPEGWSQRIMWNNFTDLVVP